MDYQKNNNQETINVSENYELNDLISKNVTHEKNKRYLWLIIAVLIIFVICLGVFVYFSFSNTDVATDINSNSSLFGEQMNNCDKISDIQKKNDCLHIITVNPGSQEDFEQGSSSESGEGLVLSLATDDSSNLKYNSGDKDKYLGGINFTADTSEDIRIKEIVVAVTNVIPTYLLSSDIMNESIENFYLIDSLNGERIGKIQRDSRIEGMFIAKNANLIIKKGETKKIKMYGDIKSDIEKDGEIKVGLINVYDMEPTGITSGEKFEIVKKDTVYNHVKIIKDGVKTQELLSTYKDTENNIEFLYNPQWNIYPSDYSKPFLQIFYGEISDEVCLDLGCPPRSGDRDELTKGDTIEGGLPIYPWFKILRVHGNKWVSLSVTDITNNFQNESECQQYSEKAPLTQKKKVDSDEYQVYNDFIDLISSLKFNE